MFARTSWLPAECSATFRLALPLIGGQLASVAMNVIDTVYAGRLGTDVLAAVAMGYQAWIIALLIVIGVMLAVSPATAQLDGAGRRGEVGPMFRQALWLALLLGVLLMLGVRQAEPLLAYAGVAPEILPEAGRFLRAISWGAPALALFFACKNLSDGLSLTRPSLYVGAAGAVLLLPVAYVLMFGALGLPGLKAAGAGYAHALVMWLEALAFLVYLGKRRHYRAAALFARFDPPRTALILELLRVGIPMGMAIFMEGSLFVAVALLVGGMGTVAASAHAIAINVASIAFMLPLGLAMATTVRVGNAVGREDGVGIARAGWAGATLALGTQTLSAGTMLLGAGAIARLYTDDAAVVTLAISLLGCAALFQFADGAQALFNGALRGLKDTFVPMWITIGSYWGIGMGLAWYFGVVREGGAVGLWLGLLAGLSAAAIGLGSRFVVQSRRRRQPE